MRSDGRKVAIGLLVALVAVVFVTGRAWGAGSHAMPLVDNDPGNPFVPSAVAKGSFTCNVMSIDPPVGTGTPEGSAGIEFSSLLGLIGTNMATGIPLGSGANVNQICQAFTDQMSGRIRTLGCVPSATRIVDNIGGNFTQRTWTIDIVCVNQANRVVDAVGALIVSVVTAPAAQLTIQRTDPESRAPISRGGVWAPLQPLNQRLPADQ